MAQHKHTKDEARISNIPGGRKCDPYKKINNNNKTLFRNVIYLLFYPKKSLT
jgi:hypothetical protein